MKITYVCYVNLPEYRDRLRVFSNESVDSCRVRSGGYVNLVHDITNAAADARFLFLVRACLTQTFVVETVRG